MPGVITSIEVVDICDTWSKFLDDTTTWKHDPDYVAAHVILKVNQSQELIMKPNHHLKQNLRKKLWYLTSRIKSASLRVVAAA